MFALNQYQIWIPSNQYILLQNLILWLAGIMVPASATSVVAPLIVITATSAVAVSTASADHW